MRTLNRKYQDGSAGGYIIAILVLGALITMGARLGPLYMDHNTMSSIMDGMSEEEGLGSKRDSQIIDMMIQRFKLNNIRDFPVKEHVEVKRGKRGTDIILDYEVRIPMVHNLDVIASFNKEIELRD